MYNRLFKFFLFCITVLSFAFSSLTAARGKVDVDNDVEDISAESDGAIAEAKEVKERIANDRADADRALKNATKNYNAAAAKRQQAIEQFNQSENDIKSMEAEQARLNAEVEKINAETAATQKSTLDNRAKLEKANLDLQTLKQVRAEKVAKLAEINAQRDEIALTMKDMEQKQLQGEQELQQLKEQEKQQNEVLAKAKLEEAQKKVKLEAYLAELKTRNRESQDRLKTMQTEKLQAQTANQKLESQVKAGETEVKQGDVQVAARSVNTVPVAAGAGQGGQGQGQGQEILFKRNCRVFDGPTRGSKVLEVKPVGTAVSKVDEGKTWIAFSLSDGRKGFAARGCF